MIKDVMVACKTHLDIGFTDLAAKVKRRYFGDYLEQAVTVAEHYRRQAQGRNYVWTVGAWLIYEYLENFTGTRRRFFEDAIRRGDIVWHALPFTMHSELNSEFTFSRSLAISKELDRRFQRRTIAAKMTDVPGHTRGIVAPLAAAGVKLLHLGINPASAMAEVPPIFHWNDARGNRIMVIYQGVYGSPCLFPDGQTVLRLELTNDNHGPHTITQMDALYETLEKEYPGAKIRCVTLNEAALALEAQADALPVITAEIGDTWIHGVGSDPLKVGQFKNLCRWRETLGNDRRLTAFDTALLQITEHTWGLDEKSWLPEDSRFVGAGLQEMQASPEGRRFASSWHEQRMLLNRAIRQAPDELRPGARRAMRNAPQRPNIAGAKRLSGRAFETTWFIGEFAADGSLQGLRRKHDGTVYADASHALFRLWGERFSKSDYGRFQRQYNRGGYDWAVWDFSKPLMPSRLGHRTFSARLQEVYRTVGNGVDRLVLRLSMPSSDLTGMPGEIYLTYDFARCQPVLSVTLDWFGKFPARLPHAINLECHPVQSDGCWEFRKLGEVVDLTAVVVNGARGLHAVDADISCQIDSGRVVFRSLHAPLVAPGQPHWLDFDNRLPDLGAGFNYNLYNNLWGTNFPMWYDDDTRFQFEFYPD